MATADPRPDHVRNSIDRLTRQAIGLYRIQTLCWAAGLGVVSTIAYIGLDYSLRVEEVGWRWLLSVLWLATIGGIVWRYAPDALSFALTPVQVAQWIERRRPELGDSLSRLVSLRELPDHDQRYGSEAFRRAAASEQDQALDDVPWQTFLDRRPTVQAGLFCLIALVMAACLALTYHSIATRGLARIALPWTWAPWPRSEQLELIDPPQMLAQGSEWEVRVRDQHPPLPPVVELEVRGGSRDDSVAVTRLPMRVVSDMAVVTLPGMNSGFAVRPVGGDQLDGPWYEIEVTRQPQLKEYAFDVQPPAYSGQPRSQLVGQRIDVLAGSRVTLRGRFDEPLRSLTAIAIPNNIDVATNASATGPATANNSAESGNSANETIAWTAQLDNSGTAFELFAETSDEALVQADRRWRLELVTASGLRVSDTKPWMMHVIMDRAPSVTLAPIEPREITRNASLPVVGTASDDLGLVEVSLVWQASDQPAQTVLLWPVTTGPAENSAATMNKSLELQTEWNAARASLSVGQTVTLELVARDSAGQIAKSLPQTLTVLDEAAALANLQRKQTELFDPLRQILDAQRRNQQALDRALDVAQQVDKLGNEQWNAVSGAQQLGRNIVGSLVRNPDSLTRQLEDLEQQLQRNHLQESTLANDTAQLRARAEQLVKDQLEPALQELEQAQQAMRSTDATHAGLDKLAQAVARHQRATQDLQSLADSAAVSVTLADIQKQAQELVNNQADITKETERLQVDTVVRSDADQLDATRAGLHSDQQSLARRVEELAERLQRESQIDSVTAEAHTRQLVENARRQLLEHPIADQMRQAATQVQDDQLTEALLAQREVQQWLEQVVMELGGPTGSGLEASSESMQLLARQLSGLAATERQLADSLKQAEQADANARQTLTEAQKALGQSIEAALQEPAAQSNQSLRSRLEEAQQAAASAAQSAEQNKFESASQNAQQAAEALDTAAQSASERAAQLKQQVAQQQMFDLHSLLASAVKLHEPVVAGLEQYAAAQAGTNTTTPPVDTLLSSEQQTQQKLTEGRAQLRALDAFHWLLGQCDDELLRTIAALERERTGPETLASARAVLEMLQAAEVATKPDSNAASSTNNSEQTQASSDQADDQPSEKAPLLASLRLLRQMQTLINKQSEQLLADPDTADNEALVRMAERQQALAEQVARLREQMQ